MRGKIRKSCKSRTKGRKSCKSTTKGRKSCKSKGCKCGNKRGSCKCGYKRSRHKRSRHKRSRHKRSRHKRSRHKRSRHKRSRRSRYGGKQRGGALVGSEFLNLGRSFVHNMGNVASTFRGEEHSVNPLPTKDQPIDTFDASKFGRLSAVNVNDNYEKAVASAEKEYVTTQ
jgi:hypothetical protein